MGLLPPRLKPLLAWIDAAMIPVDIGSNHGYLARAIATKLSHKVYATELSDASFQHLKQQLEGCGVIAYQADGLAQLPAEVNTAIITGMGGLTIQTILHTHPKATQQLSYLLLGPQSDVDSLRAYVTQTGWRIREENMVHVHGKFYPFLFLVKGKETLTAAQLYLGPRLLEQQSPTFLAWKKSEFNRLETLMRTVSLTEKDQKRLQWLKNHVKH